MERIQSKNDTIYVVNFWATWCGPCVKELPNFEKLQEKFKKEKLKVLLVSVDFRSLLDSKVNPFVQKRKMKTEVVLLDEKDQQKYIDQTDPSWSGAIPATIFIKNNKRKFFEKEFSYDELLSEYLSIKK